MRQGISEKIPSEKKIKEVEENITSATEEAPLTLLCKILTFKYDGRADQKQGP